MPLETVGLFIPIERGGSRQRNNQAEFRHTPVGTGACLSGTRAVTGVESIVELVAGFSKVDLRSGRF